MKKVLLALTVLTGLGVSAQSQRQMATTPDIHQLNPAAKVSTSEEAALQKEIEAKQQYRKTNGGVITNAFVNFSDSIANLYSTSTTFGNFQIPLYSDSLVKQEYSNGTSYVDQHAMGFTFDPTSTIYGANTFAKTDPYTIDSVYIFGSYRAPSSMPNPTGDSLIVELVYAPRTDSATYGGVYYSPNAANPDTCFMTVAKVKVNPGVSFKLKGGNRIRKGIALTGADLVDSATSRLYGIAINQQIPAGNLTFVSFKFKSSHSISNGDIYFSTVSQNHCVIPNFSGRTFQESPFPSPSSSASRWFCDPDGRNGTSFLYNTTLYKANTGSNEWRNHRFSSDAYSGNRIFFMVSGISHFGIDENNVQSNMNLYPNPTTGNLNISIKQGGAYTVEVVNMVGQVVYSEKVNVNGNEVLNRDFSNLTKGIYLVSVKGENFTNTTKLTIK